jgi:hypothetical protein
MQLMAFQLQYLWGPTVENVALLGNIKCERVCEQYMQMGKMRFLWALEFRAGPQSFRRGEGGAAVFIVGNTGINLGPLI